MEILAGYGYAGLFVASFLAATLLPLSSEIVLGALLLSGADPLLALGTATAGNVLGSSVNYALGLWGSEPLLRRVLRISAPDLAAARRRFGRYGIWSLLFAWVPLIGDPLTVVAGALKVPIGLFLPLVTLGKLARYVVVSAPLWPA